MVKIYKKGGSVCQSCGVTRQNEKNNNVPFLSFPQDEARRGVWIKNSGLFHLLKKREWTKRLSLCGRHFTDDMFVNSLKRKLNWSAVPTIFFGEFSNYVDNTQTADSKIISAEENSQDISANNTDKGEGPLTDQTSRAQDILSDQNSRVEDTPTDVTCFTVDVSTDQTSIIQDISSDQTSIIQDISSETRRRAERTLTKGVPERSKDAKQTAKSSGEEVWAAYWAYKERKDLAREALSDGERQVRRCNLQSPPEEESGYEAWSKYKKDAGQRIKNTEPLSGVMETSLPRMEFSEAAALLQRLRNCEVFTWKNEEVTLQEDRSLPGEMSSLCRLCASDVAQEMVQIFGAEGVKLRLSHKISRFLPVQVDLETDLPQQVCRECVNKLSVCDEVYRTWETAERTFRTIRRNKQADLNTTAEVPESDILAASESLEVEEASVPSPEIVVLEDIESNDETESEVLETESDVCDIVHRRLQTGKVREKKRKKILPENVQKDFSVLNTKKPSVAKSLFYCKLCNKGLRSLRMLSTHSFYSHGILMCGFCGKSGCYADKNVLNNHMDICNSNINSATLRSKDKTSF